MAIENFEHDALRCSRCSYCKWVPWENARHPDFLVGCPSTARYHFHAYSSGGKFNMALALMKGRIDYTDGMLDAFYRCQECGSCDVSCKTIQDIEPLECMQEVRNKCVEEGQLIPEHMPYMDSLKKEDNMMLAKKADRGKWAEGLSVKDLSNDKAEVLFHVGCRYSFDEELSPVARGGLELLMNAGVDIGIMGSQEACCGGRAYKMGYAGELQKYAEHHADTFKKAGVKTVVTPCSDCYQCFKVLYDKIEKKPNVEVFHITEYLHQLITKGKLKLTKEVPLTVTYHDPCNLGRLSEPWVHWKGKEVKKFNQLICHEPPKQYRRGAKGVYQEPREILAAIPGVKLVEMYRIKESAWCCGAGGGVKEAYPEFALWTAAERLKEAKAVGANALVSACPHCTRNFRDAAEENGEAFPVYDIIELVRKAV